MLQYRLIPPRRPSPLAAASPLISPGPVRQPFVLLEERRCHVNCFQSQVCAQVPAVRACDPSTERESVFHGRHAAPAFGYTRTPRRRVSIREGDSGQRALHSVLLGTQTRGSGRGPPSLVSRRGNSLTQSFRGESVIGRDII